MIYRTTATLFIYINNEMLRLIEVMIDLHTTSDNSKSGHFVQSVDGKIGRLGQSHWTTIIRMTINFMGKIGRLRCHMRPLTNVKLNTH